MLVGYGHAHAVSKHERSRTAPPLLVALAYQVIFEIPIDQLFPGFYAAVMQSVSQNVQELKLDMEKRKVKPSPEKAQWLTTRRIA